MSLQCKDKNLTERIGVRVSEEEYQFVKNHMRNYGSVFRAYIRYLMAQERKP